jgi:cysteinyl-tRNA synthetase
LIRKALEFNDFKVKQVINITDVGHLTSDDDFGEDKVEEQAKKTSIKFQKNLLMTFINGIERQL